MNKIKTKISRQKRHLQSLFYFNKQRYDRPKSLMLGQNIICNSSSDSLTQLSLANAALSSTSQLMNFITLTFFKPSLKKKNHFMRLNTNKKINVHKLTKILEAASHDASVLSFNLLYLIVFKAAWRNLVVVDDVVAPIFEFYMGATFEQPFCAGSVRAHLLHSLLVIFIPCVIQPAPEGALWPAVMRPNRIHIDWLQQLSSH